MLILARRVGESIVIGPDVWISVLSVEGRQIRLGISAPKEIAIHREEIFQKIQAQGECTARKGPPVRSLDPQRILLAEDSSE